MAKHDGIHPAPVYVATFADGTIARMSYYSLRSKPLRQDAARDMVCRAIGFERVWNATNDHMKRFRLIVSTKNPPPAADIVSGHTERKDTGEIIADPHFAPQLSAPAEKPKRRAVVSAD